MNIGNTKKKADDQEKTYEDSTKDRRNSVSHPYERLNAGEDADYEADEAE